MLHQKIENMKKILIFLGNFLIDNYNKEVNISLDFSKNRMDIKLKYNLDDPPDLASFRDNIISLGSDFKISFKEIENIILVNLC